MSTPSHEDKLAALLREQAETVVPAGDGLQRIQKRVATRRKARWLVLPSAAVVTAAAVAAFFVFSNGGDDASLRQVVHSPDPTVTQVEPTTEPTTEPTPAGGGLDHAFENPALWPFTSAQQIADWQVTYPYAEDKVPLVQHYLKDALHLAGTFALTKPCESCDVVDISFQGKKIGQAALERYELDGHRVYTIVTVGQTDLKITTPAYGDPVTSPTTVTGRIVGVDENVNLSLVTQAGNTISTAGAPAGSEIPWTAQLRWTDTDWTAGGIVAKTFSAKDGSLNRLTAVPVTRGSTSTAAGSTFTAVRAGRVDSFDATDGHFLKHLTYPPSGDKDVEATTAGGRVVWLRQANTGCTQTLGQIKDGKASLLVPAGYKLRNPRLSADGGTVAYWREPCAGGAGSVVVVSPSGTRTLSSVKDEPYGVLDVADDGRLLLSVNYGDGGTILVPAGSTNLSDGPVLAAKNGCHVDSAAFDGAHEVAWEQCQVYDNALVTFSSSATRLSKGPDTGIQFIFVTSVRNGQILVSGSARDDTRGQVFRYGAGTLTALTPDADGVGSADW